MADYLCIDGGTTNTRITLVSDGTVLESVCYPIGSGKRGNRELLKEALKSGLAQMAETHGVALHAVEAILASGMLTSAGGLCEIPHIPAPAGLRELHDAITVKSIPEICEMPFHFIPGVKTVSDSLERSDIMRGEETELMGLGVDIADALVLLPGSHCKCIAVSPSGKIEQFRTFLTGEMLHALSSTTILSQTVDLAVPADKDFMKKGYEYCEKHGINEALFKTRILDTRLSCTPAQCTGFFMGAVLCGELRQIAKAPQSRLILAGKKELKDAAAYLLTHVSQKEVICVGDTAAANAPALGAVKIYEA